MKVLTFLFDTHTHTHTFINMFQSLGYKNKKHNPQWINKKNNEVDS